MNYLNPLFDMNQQLFSFSICVDFFSFIHFNWDSCIIFIGKLLGFAYLKKGSNNFFNLNWIKMLKKWFFLSEGIKKYDLQIYQSRKCYHISSNLNGIIAFMSWCYCFDVFCFNTDIIQCILIIFCKFFTINASILPNYEKTSQNA